MMRIIHQRKIEDRNMITHGAVNWKRGGRSSVPPEGLAFDRNNDSSSLERRGKTDTGRQIDVMVGICKKLYGCFYFLSDAKISHLRVRMKERSFK